MENTNYLDRLQGTRPETTFVETDVKAINEEAREVLHLITTPSRDRMGDVVDSKGADLRNYKQNPVVLVNHDYSVESIIGKAVELDVTKEGIYARTKFFDTPVADAAFALTKEAIGGWSIGFAPQKSHSIKQGKDDKCPTCAELFDALAEGKDPGDYVAGAWGQHFKAWEMLEYSSVAIPANQEIVNNAVQRGLCPEALVNKFFETEQATPSNDAADGPTVEPAPQPEIYAPSAEVGARLRQVLNEHDARVDRRDTEKRVKEIMRSHQ